MRVLHSIWSAGFGGIEKLTFNLGLAQKKMGIEASIMISKGAGELLQDFRRNFPRCDPVGLSGGWDVSPAKYRRAVQACRDHDLVHIHTFNPLIALAAVRSGRPIVYTEHGVFGQGRKRTFSDRLKKIMAGRLLNGHTDCITFNSEWTRRMAEDRYGLQKTAKRVIYNGIDLERHTAIDEEKVRQIRSRYDGAFIVGTTSRFAGVKRVDRLIDGFAAFQEGRNTVLLLVGDGILRGELEEQARRLGIEEKTVFAGFQHDVADWQAAMDICVFPSRNESFGLVAVEALSLGKPAVVFEDAGGMKEIIEPMEPRDVVADISGLAARLAVYYDSGSAPAAAEMRIARSREFGISSMAGQMKDIYEEVLRGR